MDIRYISWYGYDLNSNPVGEAISVCPPNVVGSDIGNKAMTGKEIKPSMRAIPTTQPSARTIKTYPFYVDNL